MSLKGITFDFYLTLVHHGQGKGRGALYRQYLAEHGIVSEPWEHQVLYDVFEFYADRYRSDYSEKENHDFWREFTQRLFKRTGVGGDSGQEMDSHAENIRYIFGPESFRVFPEVRDTLAGLQKRGFRLAVLSNWQRGLRHFCHELSIDRFMSAIIASAEVGYEKPDPFIFEQASWRLQLPANQLLHIGDSLADDYRAAKEAGFEALLINRDDLEYDEGIATISDLSELLQLV
ncbi:HAD-IA family hydrolase [bacterium]|nr:HAD-IA family hydrolase [bacterium]